MCCLIYKAASLLIKEGLLTVSRKSDITANKSNDDHNVELDEQSRKTVHRLAREHLHLQFQNEKTGRTENDKIQMQEA